MVYYNEHDPFAAAWLRELIAAGHIAFGVVDERSIEDVLPSELRQFKQCHFFAGIGVWSYTLRRAGWPDDRQVWTGSCPCQPFSAAGKGDGFADERHLWPAFHHLIEQCKPDVVFGEQVASKDGLAWIDLVLADLEGTGYAAGAVDTCAAGFGAPHIRQRLYWMGNNNNTRSQGRERPGDMELYGRTESIRSITETGALSGMGNTEGCGRAGQLLRTGGGMQTDGITQDCGAGRPRPTNGHWRDADWLFCRDEKWRPVRPGTFPLAHGVAARVGRLRGYGNALNAEAAQGFIEAYMSAAI